MVELTNREIIIITMKNIMDGKHFEAMPTEIRSHMVGATLKTLGVNFGAEELEDIGDAIADIQKRSQESLVGFLQTNKDLVAESIEAMGKNGKKWRF